MTRSNKPTAQSDAFAFLPGGGEIGERIRAHNWSLTSLGPVENWPQSLKTALRIMLDSRYPMFVWWGEERINFYNDAYIPVLGKRHPHALGQRARDIWKEIWPVVGPQSDIVLKEGRATWNEDTLLLMERNHFLEETYFTFSYSPLPDDEGGIGGVFCACTEETPRVLSQRRLRTLRDLADLTAQARTAENACELTVTSLANNPYDLPFVALYLRDGEQAALKGVTGLPADGPACPPQIQLDGEKSPWPFAQVYQTGKALLVSHLPEKVGPLPGGAWPESPQQAIVLPLAKPGQPQLAGFLVAGLSPRLALDEQYMAFLDLLGGQVATAVANARAYEEERRQAEALAKLDRAKTDFFSNISHEFRTPLALMLGPLEIILNQEKGLPQSARDQLQMVHRNSLRLLKLVNTMLDFSRIEAGRIQASYEPVDLARYTAELASVFRSAVEKAGLRLVVNCPPLPEPVFVDRDMWEKIVLNLLSNAFKFTLEGEIEVSLTAENSHALLTVRDTGVGIPTAELPKIFDRFHRVKETRGRSYEGTGIGLALVQELVRLHGGTVQADSVFNEGARFVVSIPLGARHLNPQDVTVEAGALSPTTGAEAFVQEALRWLPQEAQMNGEGQRPYHLDPVSLMEPLSRWDDSQAAGTDRPRIVWADDNADLRQYVTRLLADRFEVTAVANGQDALSLIRADPPDLVLADVMMPGLDGVALLQAIRTDSKLQDLPVILLSARAGEEARLEGLEAGADDYMIKPFSWRELVARVEGQIRLSRMRHKNRAALRESEERYRAIVEGQTDMVCRFRPDGTILFVNNAYARARGTKPETLMGTNFWAFVNEEDRPGVQAILDQLRPEAPEVRIENRFETTEGTRWTLWTNRALTFDENGRAVEVQSAGMDITARKRAEEAVRSNEQRLRLALKGANAGAWSMDIATKQTHWSVEYYSIYGYDPATPANHNLWTARVHPDDLAWIEADFEAQLASEATEYQQEYRILHPERGIRWILDMGYIHRDADGTAVRVDGINMDITNRKTAEEALRQLNEQLEQRVTERTIALKRQNQRLRQLANELSEAEQKERRRLARMLHDGLQQILIAGKIQLSTISEEDMAETITRLEEIFNEAILVSRSLSYDLSPPVLYSSDLREAIHWLARWFQTNHRFEIQVTAEKVPALPDHIKNFLFDAVRELLLNAVKHSGVKTAVVALHQQQPGQISITVTDNGQGFNPENLDKGEQEIFGFGLFRIRERLTALGGSLTIKAHPGDGASFIMVMPVTDVEQQPYPDTVVLPPPLRVVSARTPTEGGRLIRVLVVDDHSIVRKGLVSLLDREEDIVVVGEASDGQEALERVHELQPSVVVMDIDMPRMNGVEATRRIKQQFPNTLIIGLSVYEEHHKMEEMRRAGASTYLRKGGDADTFLKTIRTVE